MPARQRRRPGEVRDAIKAFLEVHKGDASTRQICEAVSERLGGEVASSSVRSYLNLNTPTTFARTGHGHYRLARKK